MCRKFFKRATSIGYMITKVALDRPLIFIALRYFAIHKNTIRELAIGIECFSLGQMIGLHDV